MSASLIGRLYPALSVDVANARASLRNRHLGPSIMGFVITLYAFVEADRRPINARRLSVFTATLIVFAGGIALIFAAQRFAPHPRLCDLCLQSIPHIQFGRELRARFGPDDAAHPPIDAGQLRIKLPAARVLELYVRAIPHRPWAAVCFSLDRRERQAGVARASRTGGCTAPLGCKTERRVARQRDPLGEWTKNGSLSGRSQPCRLCLT